MWESVDTLKFKLLSLASKPFRELATVSFLPIPESQPLFTITHLHTVLFHGVPLRRYSTLPQSLPSLLQSVQGPLLRTGRTLLSPHASAPNQPHTRAFRPLTSSVAVSELFSFSEPQFPHDLLHSLGATVRNEVVGLEPGT